MDRNPSADTATTEGPGAPPSIADAFRDSARHFGEAKEYAGHYVSAKLDALKLSVRSLVFYAVLMVMGMMAGIAVIATGVVLLCIGIAHGIGTMLGGMYWLGDLIVGLVVMCGFAAVAISAAGRFKSASRKRTVSKYESRRIQQQNAFGHDVAERAAAAGRVAN